MILSDADHSRITYQVLNLLVDQRISIFDGPKVCSALGQHDAPESPEKVRWARKAVIELYADRGYVGYEWPTYVDLEFLVATRMVLEDAGGHSTGIPVIEESWEKHPSRYATYGLFGKLSRAEDVWPAAVPWADRSRFLQGVVARILAFRAKPLPVFEEIIPDVSELTDLEVKARSLLSDLALGYRGSLHEESLQGLALLYSQLREGYEPRG